MLALPIFTGSDATAAGGGLREQSEWQRSIKSRMSVSLKILSGTATGAISSFGNPKGNDLFLEVLGTKKIPIDK